MSSNIKEEMIDQFFKDLDVAKGYILQAMDDLVEKEDMGVRSMLFAATIVVLHANRAMADDLFNGESGYLDMIEMAKAFVELADQANESVEEMFTGTMH